MLTAAVLYRAPSPTYGCGRLDSRHEVKEVRTSMLSKNGGTHRLETHSALRVILT